MEFECESMASEDYRIIVKNDNMIKCFRDGRIFTKFIYKDGREKWTERTNHKPANNGYIRIQIGTKFYSAHRLIMEAFEGESEKDVDHINRVKTDNRYENLRYCTTSENNLNREFSINAKGYWWEKKSKKWRVEIYIVGKRIYLGLFENEEDAKQVAQEARAKRQRK